MDAADLCAQLECGVLAGALADPSKVSVVAAIVAGEDFRDAGLGKLFDALSIIVDGGGSLQDLAVVASELTSMRLPFELCDSGYLSGLRRQGQQGDVDVVGCARRVSAAGRTRRAAAAASDLARLLTQAAERANRGPERLLDVYQSRIDQLIGGREAQAPVTLGAAAEAWLLDQSADRPTRGIMSGILSVDAVLGMVHPGEVLIVAARPGVGKTSFGMQAAVHNAERGRHVLFVSLEMTAAELAARELCARSDVSHQLVRTGRLDDARREKLSGAVAAVKGLPIAIWDPHVATLAQIRGVCRRQQAASGLDLLVIDYVGLVRPADAKRPRHEQMAETSAGCKALAKELSIPVIVLAQVNRAGDDGDAPRLSHLAESGALERDADIVVFLHEGKGGERSLVIRKHRHGPTGRIRLSWRPEMTRFADEPQSAPARRRDKGTEPQRFDFGEYSVEQFADQSF